MNEIDNENIIIFEFWDFLVRFKSQIALTILLVTLVGFFYAITTESLYRAQVLMVEADNQGSEGLSSIADQIGGFTGIDIGSSKKSSDSYVAILKSRSFIEDFINRTDSKKIIFKENWNEEEKEWNGVEPSDFKSYYLFQKDILSVSKNVKTGVFTLSIVWHDPRQSALWANSLVESLNQLLRLQAIEEAEKRISFLEEQTRETKILGLQNMISALIQSQYEKAMIANVKEEYGFKIIDPAKIPEVKFSPNRTLVVILSFTAGIFLGILVAILLNIILNYREYKSST